MKKKLAACLLAALCACACLFAFSACSESDKNDLIGEWRIQNTEVTVVFSGTQFKLVGNTFDYTIDTGNKTITYVSGGATGTAKYSLSSDKRQLTLEESDGSGGTKTTVFDKVSSNGDAKPSVAASMASSSSAAASEQAGEQSENIEENGNE